MSPEANLEADSITRTRNHQMKNRIPPGRPPSQRPWRRPDPGPEPSYPRGLLSEEIAMRQVRETIRGADVIFGVDVRNLQNVSLFYGQTTLERIVKSGNSKGLNV